MPKTSRRAQPDPTSNKYWFLVFGVCVGPQRAEPVHLHVAFDCDRPFVSREMAMLVLYKAGLEMNGTVLKDSVAITGITPMTKEQVDIWVEDHNLLAEIGVSPVATAVRRVDMNKK